MINLYTFSFLLVLNYIENPLFQNSRELGDPSSKLFLASYLPQSLMHLKTGGKIRIQIDEKKGKGI